MTEMRGTQPLVYKAPLCKIGKGAPLLHGACGVLLAGEEQRVCCPHMTVAWACEPQVCCGWWEKASVYLFTAQKSHLSPSCGQKSGMVWVQCSQHHHSDTLLVLMVLGQGVQREALVFLQPPGGHLGETQRSALLVPPYFHISPNQSLYCLFYIQSLFIPATALPVSHVFFLGSVSLLLGYGSS